MIPISDSVAVRRMPWVTTSLVVICIALFVYELALSGRGLDAFIRRWGANPEMIYLAMAGHPRVPRTELLTLFTSQFLHGDWLHLLGNMVFLWVFGKAVEDRLGHLIYLAMYLLGGAAAGLFQSWILDWQSDTVLIGASGAIATVLGAYLVSFPTAWVRVLVPILFLFWAFDVPAVLMLAFWFFGQLFNGVASITQVATPGHIAFWAHISGFVGGMAVGMLLPKPAGRGVPGRGSGAPGPAGLVSSVATLAGVLLATRIVLRFFEVRGGSGLLGEIAAMVYGITNLVVLPLQLFIPRLSLFGQPIDLPALAAMLLVYLVAGLLIRGIQGGPSRGLGGRGRR